MVNCTMVGSLIVAAWRGMGAVLTVRGPHKMAWSLPNSSKLFFSHMNYSRHMMASQGSKRSFPTDRSHRQTVKRRKVKRQTNYHSSSSESEDSELDNEHPQPRPTNDATDDATDEAADQDDSADGMSQDDSEAESESIDSDDRPDNGPRRKRNDPTAFATSMSKILNTKLATSKRSDPVLSRSKDASNAVKEITEAKLEAKARQKLKDEKNARFSTLR